MRAVVLNVVNKIVENWPRPCRPAALVSSRESQTSGHVGTLKNQKRKQTKKKNERPYLQTNISRSTTRRGRTTRLASGYRRTAIGSGEERTFRSFVRRRDPYYAHYRPRHDRSATRRPPGSATVVVVFSVVHVPDDDGILFFEKSRTYSDDTRPKRLLLLPAVHVMNIYIVTFRGIFRQSLSENRNLKFGKADKTKRHNVYYTAVWKLYRYEFSLKKTKTKTKISDFKVVYGSRECILKQKTPCNFRADGS